MIPIDSDWYEPELLFSSELQPDTLTRGLKSTGYQTPAAHIPDPAWLESRIISILENSISSILESDAYSRAVAALKHYPETVGVYSSTFLVDESIKLSGLGRSIAQSLLPASDISSSRLSLSEGHSIEIVDIRGRAIVVSCVGLANQLRFITTESIQTEARKVVWSQGEHYIRATFPPHAMKRLQQLQGSIQFELAAEGRRVTPDWFVEHEVGAGFLEFLAEAAEKHVILAEELLADLERFRNSDVPLLAAQTIARGIEVCAKCETVVEESDNLAQRLRPLQNEFVGDFLNYDYDKLRTRIEELRHSLILGYGSIAPALSRRSWANQDWPDYMGNGYITLMDACVDCLFDNDSGNFASLWLAFIETHSALLRQQRTRDITTQGRPLQSRTEFFYELIYMSGLAIAIAELTQDHGKSEIVLEFWNTQFESCPDDESRRSYAEFIAEIARLHSDPWQRGFRSLIRTEWKMAFERLLRGEDLISNSLFDPFERRTPQPPPHVSPLVNAILVDTTDFGMYADIADIFVVAFLVARCEFADLPLTTQGQTLATRLEHGWPGNKQDDES